MRGKSALDGHFGSEAYQHKTYPLAVLYGDSAARQLVGDDWTVVNYTTTDDGVPSEIKTGPQFERSFGLDGDGDGAVDAQFTVPAHDLLLEHNRTGATIWLRTLPYPERLAMKEMHVLLHQYLDSAAGSGKVIVELKGETLQVKESERYATRILSQVPAELGGFDAIAATFELANVTQVNVANARWRRARVVLARTPFRLHAGGMSWPVILIAGYSNLQQDFDRNLSDFVTLLSRIKYLSDGERLASLAREKSCGTPHVDVEGHVLVRIEADGDLVVRPAKDKWGLGGIQLCWQRALAGFAIARGGEEREVGLNLQALPALGPPGSMAYRELQPERDTGAQPAEGDPPAATPPPL